MKFVKTIDGVYINTNKVVKAYVSCIVDVWTVYADLEDGQCVICDRCDSIKEARESLEILVKELES